MKLFLKIFNRNFSAISSIFIYDNYFLKSKIELNNQKNHSLIPANYKINTSTIPAESTDFTVAASKTINAVVHVKNTSSSSSSLPSFYRYFYDEEELPERIGTGSELSYLLMVI